MICPLCESDRVTSSDLVQSCSAPFGPPEFYWERKDQCQDCEEEGDFEKYFDNEYSEAMHRSSVASVRPILNYLEQRGMSRALVELSLHLRRGTILRWELGEISRAEITLLNLTRALPDLIAVSHNNFRV